MNVWGNEFAIPRYYDSGAFSEYFFKFGSDGFYFRSADTNAAPLLVRPRTSIEARELVQVFTYALQQLQSVAVDLEEVETALMGQPAAASTPEEMMAFLGVSYCYPRREEMDGE